ncbi:MAG: hypothetical protein N3A55_07640 [Methylohalobius sp.]|nr:hypothetical protein [Methylohalobius sp.]
MKRWIWVLILGSVLGMAACGKKEEQKPTPAAPEQPAAPAQPAEPIPGPAPTQ